MNAKAPGTPTLTPNMQIQPTFDDSIRGGETRSSHEERQTYRLLGGPGSPYSLKMRAILRYRRIPHVWIVPHGYIGSGGELQRAGKRLLPVLQYPDGVYHADTTPMAYDLERLHAQRSILPVDPGHAFLSHLVEDFADEMLSTALFDLRWLAAEDQRFCARRQLSGWLGHAPRDDFEAMVDKFVLRQTTRRAQLVQADNHNILMQAYIGTLDILEEMLESSPFLLGTRPSLGDFGLYGQLGQCAIDPTASTLMRASAVRTFQWTLSMDDVSGTDGEWHTDVPAHVRALVGLIGSHYLPVLAANARAMDEGLDSFTLALGGLTWAAKTDKYKYKCLAWLAQEFQGQDPVTRSWLEPLLHDTGCLPHLFCPSVPVAAMQPL